MTQLSIFDYIARPVKITKPIRLIELFAGYGSQKLAFNYLGKEVESHFACEFDKYAMQSYNAIHGTNYKTTDIRNIHASDLNIENTDKYCYMMTYSFPCTDLSLAGKQMGMKRESGTRSGLLWEVERLLKECNQLPQVLFMENVPQVHSEENMPDFREWIEFLESVGYVNFWQDLNAVNYGVAQTRNRCFMFSFLISEFGDDIFYKFPEPMPLNKTVRDYLENEVDEKFFLKSQKAQDLVDKLIANGELDGATTGIVRNINTGKNTSFEERDTATTITSHNYKGTSNFNENVAIQQFAVDGCVDSKRKDIANAIISRYDAGIVNHKDEKTMVCVKMDGKIENTASTIMSGYHRTNMTGFNADNGVLVIDEQNMDIRHDVVGTLTTDGSSPKHNNRVMVGRCKMDNSDGTYESANRVYSIDGACPTLDANGGGNLEKKFIDHYRIRKLTPRECGRLMGVRDDDIDAILNTVSNSQAYKQFGNSIVVDVMMNMFRRLMEVNDENISRND